MQAGVYEIYPQVTMKDKSTKKSHWVQDVRGVKQAGIVKPERLHCDWNQR